MRRHSSPAAAAAGSLPPAACLASSRRHRSHPTPRRHAPRQQFIVVTHDDAITEGTDRGMRAIIDNHKNRNGCNVRSAGAADAIAAGDLRAQCSGWRAGRGGWRRGRGARSNEPPGGRQRSTLPHPRVPTALPSSPLPRSPRAPAFPPPCPRRAWPQVPATFFVLKQDTDCALAKKFWEENSEVGGALVAGWVRRPR